MNKLLMGGWDWALAIRLDKTGTGVLAREWALAILLGCLYSTEWNGLERWNGMTTPTYALATVVDVCSCWIHR